MAPIDEFCHWNSKQRKLDSILSIHWSYEDVHLTQSSQLYTKRNANKKHHSFVTIWIKCDVQQQIYEQLFIKMNGCVFEQDAVCKSHKQLKLTYVEPHITISVVKCIQLIHSFTKSTVSAQHSGTFNDIFLRIFQFFSIFSLFVEKIEWVRSEKRENIWFSNKLFDDKFCQMEIYFLQLFRQPRTDNRHASTLHTRTQQHIT